MIEGILSRDEAMVLNWAVAHGFIAEPANDIAKATCAGLVKAGYLVERFSDQERRFPHYAVTRDGIEAMRAFVD